MTIEGLAVDSLAHGGRGVGRHDGRVVFVDGAVPGDVVDVGVGHERKRFATGTVAAVRERSPDRIAPPCPVFGRCGGCDWQMIDLPAQRRWKRQVVAGQLLHLGGLADPAVADTVAVGPGFGYRNRLDLRLIGGRPALVAARSHEAVVIENCPLANPPIEGIIGSLEPPRGADRVTIRASERTGEAVALWRRSGRWDQGRLHEIVAGHAFRITGRAFFQVNTAGAETLVGLVSEALAVGPGDTLLDGYAGGGLFAATVGAGAARVVAVESDRAALRDLGANAPDATPIRRRFETAVLPSVDLAVVDPPRAGLGGAGVNVLVAAGPRAIAYVSCDPAALGRDTRLLAAAGYRLDVVTPVDMFPQTHHIESVARFVR